MRLFTLPSGEISNEEAINLLLGPPFDRDLLDSDCFIISGNLTQAADHLIDIVEGVVCVLKTATLTPTPLSIKRGYNIHYQLEKAVEDAVYVDVAMVSDTEEPGSRGCVSSDMVVQIGVRSQLSDTTTEIIDPLVDLACQIRNLFRGGVFNNELGSTYCSAATTLQIYNPQHIADWSQFTSIIELTFLTR